MVTLVSSRHYHWLNQNHHENLVIVLVTMKKLLQKCSFENHNMITQTKVDRELRNRGDAGLKSKETGDAMLDQALRKDFVRGARDEVSN